MHYNATHDKWEYSQKDRTDLQRALKLCQAIAQVDLRGRKHAAEAIDPLNRLLLEVQDKTGTT